MTHGNTVSGKWKDIHPSHGHSTYQMKADYYGNLLHLYYGDRTEGSMEYLLTFGDRGFSPNPYEAGDDRTYSLDALPQEYPYQAQGTSEALPLQWNRLTNPMAESALWRI